MDINAYRSLHDTARGGNTLTFYAKPNDADIAFYSARKIKLGSPNITFEAEGRNVAANTHPDLLALVCLLSFGAFAAHEIRLNFGVSQGFADAVKASLRKDIGPVDPALSRRKPSWRARSAVAFSGGIDSCAALYLMPDNTVPVFLHRSDDVGKPSRLYRADAALAACDAVRKSGYDAKICRTSMEHAREPLGFPFDWSNAAPIVLHADHYRIDTIAWGMIAESAFFIGHDRFSELSGRGVYANWAPIFEYAGLPICLPTCGMSEIVTTRIALERVPQWNPQSCVRGSADAPCGKCFKCFRKALIVSSITGEKVPPSHFDIPATSREVSTRLLAEPIHHENVLAYSIQHMPACDHPVYEALRRKTSPITRYGQDLRFLERHFAGGLAYVPEKLRAGVAKKIGAVAETMSADDEAILKNWLITDIVQDPEYVAGQAALQQSLGILPVAA